MKRIIISRTDAIGDVVLTLPLTGIIKEFYPGAEIIFFGRTYTEPIIRLSSHVDQFINYDDFVNRDEKGRMEMLQSLQADAIVHVFPRKEIANAARNAGIKIRVGTSHRMYHWLTCNKLLHFSRKNSNLHEAQLNVKLLQGIGISSTFSLQQLAGYYGIQKKLNAPNSVTRLLDEQKLNIVIHPRSHGSAREWGLDNFRQLINILSNHPVNIFITGSEKEKESLQSWIRDLPPAVNDLTGKLTLQELIAVIGAADGIVAGSTGPLHIGAALGINALGIFPPIRPMHAGRWAPVGRKAQYISTANDCNDCRKNPAHCHCLTSISASAVAQRVLQFLK